MKKKTRTMTERLELVEDQQASGKSQSGWCRANGINYHTFVDLACRLRKKSEVSETPEKAIEEPKSLERNWVELPAPVLKEQEDFTKSAEKNATERFSIEIGKFRVSVPCEFEEAALLKICKTLNVIC